MNSFETHQVFKYEGNECKALEHELICEEPLLICVNGKPYSHVMRTPGDEDFHVIGFCLTEGLIDCPDDILSLDYSSDRNNNVVTVTLSPARSEKVFDPAKRDDCLNKTNYHLYGEKLIRDFSHMLGKLSDKTKISFIQVMDCVNQLSRYQKLYEKTRGSHAVLLFNSSAELLSAAEDVGRHNALDKAIGKVLMEKKPVKASLAVLSSRINYELVQKAAKAHLAILIGLSRPTALAVKLAKRLNMTLACIAKKGGGLLVFCKKERIEDCR